MVSEASSGSDGFVCLEGVEAKVRIRADEDEPLFLVGIGKEGGSAGELTCAPGVWSRHLQGRP